MPVVDDLVERLAEHGLRAAVFRDVEHLCQAALVRGEAGALRAVVAAGGDGTFRLIAEKTPPQTPLTILPLGTENLLAKYLDLSTDTQALARNIAEGLLCRLDAGEANGRLFTLMVGCGFDADVVRRLHRDRRGHIHHLSYVKPIVDAIRNYDYPTLEVRYQLLPPDEDGAEGADGPDGGQTRDRAGVTNVLSARWVFAVNLPRYAGGLNLAPGATGFDGLLNLCTFKEGSLWSGLMYLGGVMLGQHHSMEDYCQVRTAELTIRSSLPVPFQIDGDPGGELPLTIRVLPGRLNLVVSRAWAEREFDERHAGVTP